MMSYDFETTTYGKWILAGEHSVIRGHEALVFPIKEEQFILRYHAEAPSLGADFTGSNGQQMYLLFWTVLQHGFKLLNQSGDKLKGHFYLDNNISVGAGMGASAAICVAISRWFGFQNMIDVANCNEFARELEHLFHGKSSGLDIAGVSSEQGIYFKQGISAPLQQNFFPIWYLSSSNQIGVTAKCIEQVQSLWDKDPDSAQAIDYQMVSAVREAQWALEKGGDDALDVMAKAIKKASHCFERWGLISDSLKKHMSHLYAEGALAVKPTGSGGGGYVLSLWDKEPSSALPLIRV